MKNTYKIAGLNIQIDSIYAGVHRLCKDYLLETDEPVSFSVSIEPSDIESERERSAKEDAAEQMPLRRWSSSYLETLTVYRKIAEKLPYYNTFLMHGSCIAVDDQAYLFTAKSGTGKSTHARLWREVFGERAVMINDDKPLIKVENAQATVYGTPWDGKHHLSTNTAVCLKAVCILERAENNSIRAISLSDAHNMLLQQIYRPADPKALMLTLGLIEEVASCADLWQLRCNMEPEAAQRAYLEMNKVAQKRS